MYHSSKKTVLLIQPPAGTADALIRSGIYHPYEIDYLYQPDIKRILNQIKIKNYQLIILGIAVGGSLKNGSKLINRMLEMLSVYPHTQIIIYTYQGLLNDLQSFVKKNWKLPNNWRLVYKETTYYFEHDNLIKFLKNKNNPS